MGGGDSLYDKIDRGIRGCKVVLTSITQKYALSANCRREVSLADALKKPIIPLLMEISDWPPSGPMSMVFTQLKFVDFSEDETVQLRWDGPQYLEMLQQIHVHIPAIPIPVAEKPTIKAKEENEGSDDDNKSNDDQAQSDADAQSEAASAASHHSEEDHEAEEEHETENEEDHETENEEEHEKENEEEHDTENEEEHDTENETQEEEASETAQPLVAAVRQSENRGHNQPASPPKKSSTCFIL